MPAQIVSGAFGSTATDPIERLDSSSNVGNQVEPPFVVLNTPPAAAPTYTMSGSVGWHATSAIRPPMLRGPTGFHAVADRCVTERSAAACSHAATRADCRMSG